MLSITSSNAAVWATITDLGGLYIPRSAYLTINQQRRSSPTLQLRLPSWDSSQNATQVTGNLGSNVSIAKVCWEWLILPAILLAGALALLLLPIHTTKQTRTPTWNSSVNALLCHGLDCKLDDCPSLVTISSLNEQTDTVRARLSMADMGSRLVLRTTTTKVEMAEYSRPDND